MTAHKQSNAKTRARQKSGAKATVQEQGRGAPEIPTQSNELEWRERAAFHVTFDSADDSGYVGWQIRVYHEESDSHAIWSGRPDAALINWMCDKAGLTSMTLIGELRSDLQIAISDVSLDEVPIERQTGGPDRVKRLRAEVDFQISDPVAYRTSTQQSSYVAQILAYTPPAGVITILATDQQLLRPEALAYTATMEFDVPETGDYQLLAMILLSDQGAVDVILGPVLSVIP
jgi:hypothetical protein